MKRLLLPLATSLLFSGSYVAAKLAALELDPLTTTLLRYLIALAALCLIGIGYGRSHRGGGWAGFARPGPKDLALFAMLGLTGIVGYHYFFFLSLKHTQVANTAIINALSPVVTGLLAWALLRERLSTKSYVGIGLTLAGVLLLVSRGRFQPSLGDLLMIAAVFSWAIYSLLVKRSLSDQPYSSFTLTFYTTVCGVAWLLLLVPLPGAVASARSMSGTASLAVLYMGVCASGLGYLTYNLSIRSIGPTRTASFVYGVNPVLVAVLSYLIFDQPITPLMIASMTLIGAGLLLQS